MNRSQYNSLVKITKGFLFGYNFYTDFNYEDLISETLIVMAENGIEFSEELFKENITAARNRLVKNALDSNPKLRAKHNMIVKSYYHNNKEKISKKRKLKRSQGRMTLSDEYIKYLIMNNSKVAVKNISNDLIDLYRHKVMSGGHRSKNKGKRHGKFKGMIVTPFGEFESTYAAGASIDVTHHCIAYRIKSNSKKFIGYYINQTPEAS